MVRDFSDEKREELLDLIDELNEETNWFIQMVNGLISSHLYERMRKYITVDPSKTLLQEKNILRENQYLKEDIETIFGEVRLLDFKYARKMDDHIENLLTYEELISHIKEELIVSSFQNKSTSDFSLSMNAGKLPEYIGQEAEKDTIGVLGVLVGLLPSVQLNKKYEFQLSTDTKAYVETEVVKTGNVSDATIQLKLEEQKLIFKKLSMKTNLSDALSVKSDLSDELGGSLSLSEGDFKVSLKGMKEAEISDQITISGCVCRIKTIVSLTDITAEVSMESKDENGSLQTKLGIVKSLENDSNTFRKQNDKENMRERTYEELFSHNANQIRPSEALNVVTGGTFLLQYFLELCKSGALGF